MRWIYKKRSISRPMTDRMRDALRDGRGDGASVQGLCNRDLALYAVSPDRRSEWMIKPSQIGHQWRRDLRRMAMLHRLAEEHSIDG